MRAHLRSSPATGIGILLAIFAGPRALGAQDFTIPPTGVLNNYDRVQVGQREALEAGAYIARSNDAGAGWYNPAGLALVEKSNLNASANAYEFTRTELTGIGADATRTRFTPVGRFFGVVIGDPIIKNRKVRLGFAFAKPIGWSPGAIDAALQFSPSSGGTETLNFYSLVTFQTSMPSVSVGYAVSDKLRLGAGITYAVTSMSIAQELGDRWLRPTTYQANIRNLNTDGSTGQFMFGVGAQWEPTEKLRLGAKIRTPGLRVGGKSSVTFTESIFGPASSIDLSFRDKDTRFEYKMPLYIGGGAAWIEDGWEVEMDARYYSAPGDYAVFSSSVPGRLVLQGDTGDPTVSDAAFMPVQQESRSIVNLSIGGSVRLSRYFRLHGGFFSDNSPNASSDVTIFRTINMYGGSLGASATVGKLSGSVGVTGAAGTSTARDIGPSLSGATAETKLKIETMSIVYALSYSF